MSGLALYVGAKMVTMPIPFGVGVGCVGLALHVALLLACRSFCWAAMLGKDPGTEPLATDLTWDPWPARVWPWLGDALAKAPTWLGQGLAGLAIVL